MAATHALTVRLPEPVYRAARRLAARQGVSINRLVAEAISEKARQATAARLKRAYDVLAEDAAEYDVERFVGLQAEALLDD
jgi:hypothetical protein